MRRLGVVASALVALGLAGCGARTEGTVVDATAPPKVTVVRPRRADATRVETLPGDIVGRYESALFAKVTGYLKRIDVDKGDWVTQGQVLAEIEVPELEQKLARARANLQVRKGTFDRLEGVWRTDHRLVAAEDVDVAQGEFRAAKADVEELEALVGYTKIVAPFDGVVTARYVDPGALIQANGGSGGGGAESGGPSGGKGGAVPVLRIADIRSLRVYVYVPEAEASLVRRGQPAKLALRELPGRAFTGTVARFATALDLGTRTMLTEVDLDNPDHALYPGMYADVTLELERHRDALEIPLTAVAGHGDATFVLVVRDDVLVKIPVTTGLGGDAWVEVTSGLTGTESLVASPDPGLREGQRVSAVDAGAAPAAGGRG